MQKALIDAAGQLKARPRSALYLLSRFWREWMAKRWRDILWSLLLMALLAATTGAYSEIVKQAKQPDKPWTNDKDSGHSL